MKKLSKAMYGKTMMKKGGTKKYGAGGPTTKSNSPATMATPSSIPEEQKPQSNTPPTGSNKLYGRGIAKKMKTGGMVNPNAKMQAQKIAGSKGVKSKVNPKAIATKKATGKSSGGVDTPPKTAVPKAKYGMSMKKK